MTARLTIALDAMGGDHAPAIVLAGAAIAAERHPKIHYLVFGDAAAIEPCLAKHRGLAALVTLRHTAAAVSSEEKPSLAVRRRDTSMRLAIEAVKAGEAKGVVSAGNTGALMGLAVVLLGTLDGIDRPAIASFFPTIRGGESVMLDLGANTSCDEDNLVQFALMGEVFARTVLGTPDPTIGLLNIGTEAGKGKDLLHRAAARLQATPLGSRFHGFVEGDDIAAGTVDVVVTDGFTGNVALKTAEGMARLVTTFMGNAFKSSLAARIGYLFARRAIEKIKVRTDPRRYNGAVLVGLSGVVVKSHGGTDALGFASAIGVAHDMIEHGFNERMARELENLAGPPVKSPPARAAR